jgi:hypothetical protein
MEEDGTKFSLRKNDIDTIGLNDAEWTKVKKNTIFAL